VGLGGVPQPVRRIRRLLVMVSRASLWKTLSVPVTCSAGLHPVVV